MRGPKYLALHCISLVALGGATSSYAANVSVNASEIKQNVPVTFQGTVADSGCTIEVGTNNSLALGNVRPEANQKSGRIPVEFVLSGCKHGVSVYGVQKIALVGDVLANTSTAHPSLAKGKLTTNINGQVAEHIFVGLYNNLTNDDFTPETTFTGQPPSDANGHWRLRPFYAQLETGSTKPTTSGHVQAKAMFQITYK